MTFYNNTMINTTQDWIRSEAMPLTKRRCTTLLYHNLCCLQNIFYTDTLFPKVNSVTGHECAKIYTDREEFVFIMPLFSKAEVGMSFTAFANQLGIPNELHFDIATEQTGQKTDLQCVFKELCIQWRTL